MCERTFENKTKELRMSEIYRHFLKTRHDMILYYHKNSGRKEKIEMNWSEVFGYSIQFKTNKNF